MWCIIERLFSDCLWTDYSINGETIPVAVSKNRASQAEVGTEYVLEYW
jgi:hypothetical protein